jgi:hypothetical protein
MTRHLATFLKYQPAFFFLTGISSCKSSTSSKKVLTVTQTFAVQVLQFRSQFPEGIACSLSKVRGLHQPLSMRYNGLRGLTPNRLATRLAYSITFTSKKLPRKLLKTINNFLEFLSAHNSTKLSTCEPCMEWTDINML